MKNNNYNWENKRARASLAEQHTNQMEDCYKKEIDWCARHTELFDDMDHPANVQAGLNKLPDGTLQRFLSAKDSVNAAFTLAKTANKVCVLNFASYKHPGGMFINGSRAQEECLCHESFLYNVLRRQLSYYDWNKEHLNHAMYLNRALYTPDVLFEKNGTQKKIDVITCAAPNLTTVQRYHKQVLPYHQDVLELRINFVVDVIAAMGRADGIVLGAFGCGVFGQDPHEVARLFLEKINRTFSDKAVQVMFAVPKTERDNNYQAFAEVCLM